MKFKRLYTLLENLKQLKEVTKTESAKRNFAGGAVVKNPPDNAGDTGSIPGLGRSHMPQSN